MHPQEQINQELKERFAITCKKCGGTDIIFTNTVRYYDYTGKVGSADLACRGCYAEVTLDS